MVSRVKILLMTFNLNNVIRGKLWWFKSNSIPRWNTLWFLTLMDIERLVRISRHIFILWWILPCFTDLYCCCYWISNCACSWLVLLVQEVMARCLLTVWVAGPNWASPLYSSQQVSRPALACSGSEQTNTFWAQIDPLYCTVQATYRPGLASKH